MWRIRAEIKAGLNVSVCVMLEVYWQFWNMKCIVCFMMHNTFWVVWCPTSLLQSYAVGRRAEFVLALSRWNKQRKGLFLKKTSRWHHMLLQNLHLPFSVDGAFTDVQVTHTMGTGTTTETSQHLRWAWAQRSCWCLWMLLMSVFLFVWQNLNLHLWINCVNWH